MKQISLSILLSMLCLSALSQPTMWSNNQNMGNNMNWPQKNLSNNANNNSNNTNSGKFTLPFVVQGNNSQCPDLQFPVCGNNGKTYQNPCFMNVDGVTKAYDGWCNTTKSASTSTTQNTTTTDLITFTINEINGFVVLSNGYNVQNGYDMSQCNDTLNPVCGQNGVTYANYCRANLNKMAPVHYGECGAFTQITTPTKTCSCDNTFQQICASNGITYENKCVANCLDATINFVGICPQPCGCSFFFKPVCGSNGRNYLNSCAMDCANVSLFSEGLCSNDTKCGQCFGKMERVCGKDGKTYDNSCYMSCAGTTKMYDGSCVVKSDDQTNTCNCSNNYLPVCCSNGITHVNECQMNCVGATKASNGACGNDNKEPTCNQDCKASGYAPVCGTDTLTYYNKEAIKCTSGISVLYKGECKPINYDFCKCSKTYKPVCGVDGKTYLNEEVLKCINVEKYCDGTCELNGNGWIQGPNQSNNIAYTTGTSASNYTGKYNKSVNGQWYNTVWGNNKSDWVCYKGAQQINKPKTCEPQVDIKYILVKKPEKKQTQTVVQKPAQPIVIVFLPPCYNTNKFELPYDKNSFKGFDNCIPQQEEVQSTITSCYNGQNNGNNDMDTIFDDVYVNKNVSLNINDVKNTVMTNKFDANASASKNASMQQMIMNGNPNTIPSSQKSMLKDQASMYYLYFYLLINNNVISYDTKITNDFCVRDVLYYIVVEVWKLKLSVVDGDLSNNIDSILSSNGYDNRQVFASH